MLPRKNQSQLKKKSSQNCLNCDVLKEKLSLNIIIVTIFLSGGKIRGKKKLGDNLQHCETLGVKKNNLV